MIKVRNEKSLNIGDESMPHGFRFFSAEKNSATLGRSHDNSLKISKNL